MRAIVVHNPAQMSFSVHVVTRTESGLEAMDERCEWHRVPDGGELPLAARFTETEMATVMMREVILRSAERNST